MSSPLITLPLTHLALPACSAVACRFRAGAETNTAVPQQDSSPSARALCEELVGETMILSRQIGQVTKRRSKHVRFGNVRPHRDVRQPAALKCINHAFLATHVHSPNSLPISWNGHSSVISGSLQPHVQSILCRKSLTLPPIAFECALVPRSIFSILSAG